MVERILVMGFAGIGDTLLTTPVLTLLRENNPKASIYGIVTSKNQLNVLKTNPTIDEIVYASGLWKNPVTFIKTLVKLRKSKFDYVITFYPTTRILFNVLAFLSRVPKRITHSYPGDKYRKLTFLQNEQVPLIPGGHSVVQNLELLRPLGVRFDDSLNYGLTLNLSESERHAADRFLLDNGVAAGDFIVGIHPGSGGMEYKRWPLDRFISLAKKCVKGLGCQVIFFCGPRERDVSLSVEKLGGGKIHVFKGSLGETAALISKCGLFVSNDSGLMHVAVSQNVPVIGIFGPTDPEKTGPYTKNKVLVKSRIDCSPCYNPDEHRRFDCKFQRSKCLEDITVDEIYSKVQKGLSSFKTGNH